MKMIVPYPISPADILSTNVPDPDTSELWVSGASYVRGDRRIYLTTEYEARVDHASVTLTPNLDAVNWIRVGSINKLRMFDGVVGRKTSNPDAVDVSVKFGGRIVSGAGFFGLLGNELHISMTDDVEGVVYEREVSLRDNSAVTDWWSWFFEPILQKEDVVIDDMPSYLDARIDVSIVASDGEEAACGEAVFGMQRDLGLANFGSSVEIEDFSVSSRDGFGNVSVVERGFIKIADFDVSFDSSRLYSIQRALAEVRAKPVVFIGDRNREELIVYGFPERFVLVLDGPKLSSGTFRVRGIV